MKRGQLSKGIRHLLEKKRSTCQSTKDNYKRWKWGIFFTWKEALTSDEKEAFTKMGNRHLLTEKGHPSDFYRGIYKRWKGDRSLTWKEKGHVSLLKGELSELKRGTDQIWKGALIIKENVHLLNKKGAPFRFLKGTVMRRGRSSFFSMGAFIIRKRGTY